MAGGTWVLSADAGDAAAVAARVAAVRGLGPVTVLAVGTRDLADRAAAAGPDAVRWCEPADGIPVAAYAAPAAEAVAAAAPRLVVGGTGADERALLGAVAVRLGAAAVAAVRGVRDEGGALVVERGALAGAVVETLATGGPAVVVLDVADDDVAVPAGPVRIEPLAVDAPAPVRVTRRVAAVRAGGLARAATVVGVGRGLRARADLEVVRPLVAALGAELACTMPVADDLGWVDKDRYVGRSGASIAPRLYLAVGISGAPQHTEGIRGASVVAAVNSDPEAPIFRRADYGVVGDLYAVVPALVAALAR